MKRIKIQNFLQRNKSSFFNNNRLKKTNLLMFGDDYISDNRMFNEFTLPGWICFLASLIILVLITTFSRLFFILTPHIVLYH